MKIAIVSGGTGGHIYPGLAIAEEIRKQKPDTEIIFLGGDEGLEKELIPRAGYQIKLIRARALLRKISYKAISAPFVSLIGFFQAFNILKSFAPAALISTGGYASLPVVLAAKFLSIPIYIHEQNALPGFTNRLYARWAKKIFLSFEYSKRYLNGLVTGNPVRGEILAADRGVARRALNFSPAEKVVLVMGGSQGARTINNAVVKALPQLQTSNFKLQNLRIIHLIGKRDFAMIPAGQSFSFYQPVDYLYNVGEALAAADLVVSRAGATAIAEFAARGLPMFLVPFPFSAEGHQDVNAAEVHKSGAGESINNADFTPEKFISIISDPSFDLEKMGAASKGLAKPKAAEEIVKNVIGA